LLFAQFRKYKSSISCRDQEPPAIDGVWPGHVVTVECVAELSYPTGGSPARPVVSGSTRTQGGFVFYRPQLQMLVTGFSANRDEYGADEDRAERIASCNADGARSARAYLRSVTLEDVGDDPET
jgi:hypothetical protein